MSNKRKVIMSLALLFAFFLVSSMDYQDEQDQQSLFCENVKEGNWPNYKNIDCGSSQNE